MTQFTQGLHRKFLVAMALRDSNVEISPCVSAKAFHKSRRLIRFNLENVSSVTTDLSINIISFSTSGLLFCDENLKARLLGFNFQALLADVRLISTKICQDFLQLAPYAFFLDMLVSFNLMSSEDEAKD